MSRVLIFVQVVVVFSISAAWVQAQRLQPLSNGSLNDRGRLNLKTAEEKLRRKLSKPGKAPYLLHRLGTVLYRQGKVSEARKLWDEASAKEPNLASADVSEARELMTTGNLAAAKISLRSAEQRNKRDPHLYLARGNMASLEKNLDEAEQAFKRAHELNPKLMTVNIWLGRFYEARRDWNAAETLYYNAVKLAPKRPQGWLLLAGIRFQQHRMADTLTFLYSAEKADPEIPVAEAAMAGFFVKINDFVGALKWQRRAVRRKPDNVELRRFLASVEIRLGLKDEARQELEKVLEQREDLAALIMLARLEDKNRQPERARKLYRRAIKLDAKNLLANNNLAMLLIRQRQSPDEAVKLAKAALAVAPNNPIVLGTYGCALFEAGQTKEAEIILQRAVRRNPADAWVRYAFGKLLLTAKRTGAARDHLEGCLLLDPQFPRKSEVQALLKGVASDKK